MAPSVQPPSPRSTLTTTGLGGSEAYGLGAAYDLGGGAKLVGGYVSNETAGNDAYDFGISFSF